MGLFDFFKKDNQPSPEKLIKAARKGKLETVNYLLENGADVNSRDEKGWTPLIWASFKDYDGLIKLFIEKGADINAKNKEGHTALMYASGNGSVEMVKILIEAGAQVNDEDSDGRTALVFASDNGWIEMVKILMKAGAQIADRDRDEVMALINGRTLPLPVAQQPLPEFARKCDISMIVEAEKGRMALTISAESCTVNWGDEEDEDEYHDMKEKNISHRYRQAGNYTITVNATRLSKFKTCFPTDAEATAIYLNNCPQLEWLNCSFNKLTSLDISKCTALQLLFCTCNKLSTLDISNNLELNYLSCDRNLLTGLDISNNTKMEEVDCSCNQLSILNVNGNDAIERLMCNDNQLSKTELNRIFNLLPDYNSSFGTENTWYSGDTTTPRIFIACGNNPGYNDCNKIIAGKKNWLLWRKAMYVAATMVGTPGHWQEEL